MLATTLRESQTPSLQNYEPSSVLCENRYFLDDFVIASMMGYALNAVITEL